MKDAEIEQKFLEFVFTTDADITPAALAFFARCPIKRAAEVLDRLTGEGTLRLESDEHGELTYVYPKRKRIDPPRPEPDPVPRVGPEVFVVDDGLRPGVRPQRALVPATRGVVMRGYPVNPGAAALLSVVWPGAGQIYAGRVGAGIGWMMATLLGYMLLVVPASSSTCCASCRR